LQAYLLLQKGGVTVEGLTIKQEAFCLEYAQSGNATEAYKKAYGVKDEKSAAANGARMIRNDKVQTRLQEIAKQIASPKIATIAEIQEGLTKMFLGIEKETVYRVDDYGNTVAQKREASLHLRLKAGTELAKMLGAYTYNISAEVKTENPLAGLTIEELKRLAQDD
jgi:phage terminase small subunit